MKILATVLTLSIGLNITRFFDDYFNAGFFKPKMEQRFEMPGEDNCACNNNERYKGEQKPGGGEEIDLSASRQYIGNYQSVYKTPYKGGFISKKALDEIFCKNPQANGVFCYFALKDANPANFTIVLEGGTSDHTVIKNMEGKGSAIFMGEVMCPSICGASGSAE